MVKRRLRCFGVCAVFLAHFGARTSFASDSDKKPICPSKPIRIGFTELAPYYEKDGATAVGIALDVRKELAKRSGCKFEDVERPRARLWSELEKGTIAMGAAGLATPEREAFAYFANYLPLETSAVFKNPIASRIKSIEDIERDASLIIGTIRGIRYGGRIDRAIDQIRQRDASRVLEVSTPQQLFKMFLLDRVQIIFSESIAYSRYFENVSNIRTLDVRESGPLSSIGLVLSKAVFSRAEVSKWRGLVDSMKSDGTFKAILHKYVSPTSANHRPK